MLNKVPCIRDLKMFRKSGCPQKEWDGIQGCPCWKEMVVSSKENPQKKESKKQCIDLWQFELQWAMLGVMEGNQQAVESFRNGMVYPGKDGGIYPKSDPALVALLQMAYESREEKKKITNNNKLLEK